MSPLLSAGIAGALFVIGSASAYLLGWHDGYARCGLDEDRAHRKALEARAAITESPAASGQREGETK